MRLITKVLAICSSVLLSSTVVHAGGMTSSGGDNKEMGWESAWFLGTAPISYCIEIAPTESLSPQKAKSDFESVIKTWKDYVANRTGKPGDGHELNFNYQFENCQSSTRLKIYVGASNTAVELGRTRFQNPYAFAERTDYDENSGMGNGFIWFAPSKSVLPGANFPNWNAPYTFHGMLLHEIGHLLGMGHFESTIMDSEMIPYLQLADSSDPRSAAGGKMYMTNIDHHHFLKLRKDSSLEMKGIIHLDSSGKEPARVFEMLTGRKSQGKPSAKFIKTSSSMHLIYTDEIGSEKIEISVLGSTEFNLGGRLFYTVRAARTGREGFSFGNLGYSYSAKLRAKTGKNYFAVVNINHDELGRPIEIKFNERDKMTRAFQSDLWLTHDIK